jgi:hypothetical protein
MSGEREDRLDVERRAGVGVGGRKELARQSVEKSLITSRRDNEPRRRRRSRLNLRRLLHRRLLPPLRLALVVLLQSGFGRIRVGETGAFGYGGGVGTAGTGGGDGGGSGDGLLAFRHCCC